MGIVAPVTIENTGVALAKDAVEALRKLDHHGPHLRPAGTDRFAWTAEVLDELARVAEALGRAVDHASGDECPAVRQQVSALVDAIVSHRNTMLQPVPSAASRVATAHSDRSLSATGRGDANTRPRAQEEE